MASWSDVARTLALAAHPRVGSSTVCSLQKVAASPDLLLAVLRHVCLVVPDDAPTLSAALRKAAPWQRVMLRRGEHLVDARGGGLDPGSSQLCVTRPVEISGEKGTVLRGTLVLSSSCVGGSIRSLRIDDGGDCCIRCEGGSWELTSLRLRCSHGSALLACGHARVTISDCVLGGEGEEEMGKHVMLSAYGSVQDHGLAKRSCYALVLRQSARIVAHRCTMRQCSEAAVLIAHSSHALLDACTISACTAAFIAGTGLGRALELQRSVVERSCARLWADADRPAAFVWGTGNTNEMDDAASMRTANGDSGGEEEAAQSIVPPSQPRGADDDDDDSDGSLSDPAEFANMEALMEELDAAALSAAAASSEHQPSESATYR